MIKLLYSIRSHWMFGGPRQVIRLLRGRLTVYLGEWYFEGVNYRSRYCPCCGWEGRRFRPFFSGGYTTLDALCQMCGSHARHRGQMLYYRDNLRLFEKHGRVLYFAPERGILPHLQEAPDLKIETSGFNSDGAYDHSYDIMAIDASDNTFDFIICHRVIEHVPDDRRAMREIYRILKPGGTAVLSVPISRDRQKTVEYGKPNPLCDDHYYDYGMDFIERIPSEFEWRELSFSMLFDPETFIRLSLFEDSIFECYKPEQSSAKQLTVT